MICWIFTFLVLAAATPLLFQWPPARGANECRPCGYDLSGNVSGTCPECGGAIPNASTICPGNHRFLVSSRLACSGWILLVAALGTHLSFSLYHLPSIVQPAGSPYGHASPFGDLGRQFLPWAIEVPSVLGALGSLTAFIVGLHRASHRAVLPRHAWYLWLGCTIFQPYLFVMWIALFSD